MRYTCTGTLPLTLSNNFTTPELRQQKRPSFPAAMDRDEMELLKKPDATPRPAHECLMCSARFPVGWGDEQICPSCLQSSRFQESITLDLNDTSKTLSMLQINSSSVSSPGASPLELSPEAFYLPSQNRGEAQECPLHLSPAHYWCYTCTSPICVSCLTQHHTSAAGHRTGPVDEAQTLLLSQIYSEMQAVRKLHSDTKLLTNSQRSFLQRVLDSCANLELLMREELATLDRRSSANGSTINEEDATQFLLNKVSFQLGGLSGPEEVAELLQEIHTERVRLQARQQQLAMQLTLNRVISNSNQVLELQAFRHAVQSLRFPGQGLTPRSLQQSTQQTDPVALLANVCNARLYTKQLLASSLLTSEVPPLFSNSLLSPSVRSNLPRFFLDIEVDGVIEGRVVLEIRPDVAPKMSKNFAALCNGETGFGYKGCQVFQCWGGESCIAGDFECNSGRGGRSIFAEEPFFMPDDSKLPCVRGAIGMRRTQKKHHSQGLVGSQFRILLRDMPFFTGVFGHVVQGLEHVERISLYGDHQGFPRRLITIANCGQLK